MIPDWIYLSIIFALVIGSLVAYSITEKRHRKDRALLALKTNELYHANASLQWMTSSRSAIVENFFPQSSDRTPEFIQSNDDKVEKVLNNDLG